MKTHEEAIRVWKCRNWVHPYPCWHARCSGCGEATAFDFTADESRRYVENACSCTVRQGSLS